MMNVFLDSFLQEQELFSFSLAWFRFLVWKNERARHDDYWLVFVLRFSRDQASTGGDQRALSAG